MARFLWICLAGALGTGSRYLVGLWAGKMLGATFPFGTLIVNVAGSFLISLIMQLSLTTELVPPTLRLTLTTGFLGGLTTYSSFNYETLRFFQDRAWLAGIVNASVTFVCCLLAGVLGVVTARRFAGT